VKVKMRTPSQKLREEVRKKLWPDEDAWTGENELGFFQAPRTLPLLLLLLSMKAVSGKKNPSRVYLELWARHMGGGVIEMKHEGEHAYAAGYTSRRSMRTWRDHMALLEEMGLIKTKKAGNQQYKYALLVHPTAAVEALRLQGKVDSHWLETYELRQLETKERAFAQRMKEKKDATRQGVKVVPIKTAKSQPKKASA
jgi:hypothetical protein